MQMGVDDQGVRTWRDLKSRWLRRFFHTPFDSCTRILASTASTKAIATFILPMCFVR